ncbi:hypothetical protein QBC41DRAFT_341847 [Cercophora samala]|uniref:Uncharacterized protein n=1 Tax=Cercophora samala TaxID=330535 RepID=A0AA39YDA7_9PEZI|nr:hypothetical protein QBC41DRAFT_341847 [Cercophora samala]
MCTHINGVLHPCWASPQYIQNLLQKTAKPKPPRSRSRQSTRAYRTKLQDALLRSTTSPTLLKNPSSLLPRPLLTLSPTDKLSDNPPLLRHILTQSLAHDNHHHTNHHTSNPKNAQQPEDQQPIWHSLLPILDTELPTDDAAPEPVWTAQEADLIRLPNQLPKGQEDILLHPIWNRFPDVPATRRLIAEAAIASRNKTITNSPKVMQVFWNHASFKRTRQGWAAASVVAGGGPSVS